MSEASMADESHGQVCIIGAGSSGIVAAKILHERGIPFDCFEKGSGIGGLWRYPNDSGTSSAYRTLNMNTSRDTMQYSDFPMPEDYPPFPHHSLILDYFESYVDHFGFRDKITFNASVEHVEPRSEGGYDVTVQEADGERITRHYTTVFVANGHHSKPRWPEFSGSFEGEVMHSHYYEDASGFAGKRVLVVGLGNSSCDIVCETARIAAKTFLSTRRGAHIIPKYMFGLVMDRILPAWCWRYLPFKVLQSLFGLGLFLSRGKVTDYGLPKPGHRVLQEHPTISSDLLNLLGHGDITVKPTIKELRGDRVCFSDDSEEEVDVIVYATGYDISFPFLDDSVLDVSGNEVGLYRNVVHPDHPGLCFIGLVQPWGAIMPLAEAQAEWMVDLVEGKCGLPDREQMQREIERDREKMARRYTKSTRHTIQVDFFPYLDLIRKERKRRPQAVRPGREQPKMVEAS